MSIMSETWVLQARLTEYQGVPGSDQWETLTGFVRNSQEELQAVYDEHFARIDGMGCTYRFAQVIVTHDITYHEPARDQT